MVCRFRVLLSAVRAWSAVSVCCRSIVLSFSASSRWNEWVVDISGWLFLREGQTETGGGGGERGGRAFGCNTREVCGAREKSHPPLTERPTHMYHDTKYIMAVRSAAYDITHGRL